MKRLNEMINSTYIETLEQLDDILYGPDSDKITDKKLAELREKREGFHTEIAGTRHR